jgi:hypothetical protein
MLDKSVLWAFVAIESFLTVFLMLGLLAHMPKLPVIVSFALLSGINSLIFVMRVRAGRDK